jgi:hypothetical protein
MFCSDVKASVALGRLVTAVGTIWEASQLGGLNIKDGCSLEKGIRQEIVLTG